MRQISRLIGGLVVLASAMLYLWPVADPAQALTFKAGALVLFAVGLWASSALPEYLVAMLFLLLAALTAVVPSTVVFSGFTTSTLWLVFGGLILAEAVRISGLGLRLASRLLGPFSHSYLAALAGVTLVSSILCFLMPATIARILLLIPILLAFCERLGLPPGSRGFLGIMLAMLTSSFQVGATILPANIPNLVLAGTAEGMHGVQILYLEYLRLHFPIQAVAKATLTIALLYWLFPARVQPSTAPATPLPPLSPAEWRMAVILSSALGLWATDFLHHIRPGWVGLGAGLVCLLPRVGLLDIHTFNERVRLASFFYIGAVLGVGALIEATRLGTTLFADLPAILGLAPGADFWNFQVLSLLSTGTAMVATSPGQPAVLASMAAELAQATGWSMKTVLMTFAIGFSTVLLPYQVPPVVVGMYAAGVSTRDAARIFLWQALMTIMLLWPLNWLWWWLLGYFTPIH
jgi:di/tricarboxylate transporter